VVREAAVPRARGLSLFPRRCLRRVELDRALDGFGDHGLAVDDSEPVAVALDREYSLERRRRAQRHLCAAA
jgi:hypothetical protein